jgi:hypothetical protein
LANRSTVGIHIAATVVGCTQSVGHGFRRAIVSVVARASEPSFASASHVVLTNRGTVSIHIAATVVGCAQGVGHGFRRAIISVVARASESSFASAGNVVLTDRSTVGVRVAATVVGLAQSVGSRWGGGFRRAIVSVVARASESSFASASHVVLANRGTVSIHIAATIVGLAQSVGSRWGDGFRRAIISVVARASESSIASTDDVVKTIWGAASMRVAATVVGLTQCVGLR